MNIGSGIDVLDARLGGFRPGGLYVLAGPPGSGKLASALQFLNSGLQLGERAALCTAAHPQQIWEQSRHWGFGLEAAWRAGTLRLLGYGEHFERRLLRAADPRDVFDELTQVLGRENTRLVLHPGKMLWDARGGTLLGSTFVKWVDDQAATVWATVDGDLADSMTTSMESVLHAADGVFALERLPSGRHQLWVRRISPPIDAQGPVSLELVPGRGMQAPAERFDRRSTDPPIGSEERMLLVRLASTLPAEIGIWARRAFEVIEIGEPLRAITQLQEGESYGTIVVYAERARSREAVEACRALRPLTAAPIVVASDDQLRASDRSDALNAGASDVLTGSVNIDELASRVERATPSDRSHVGRRRSGAVLQPVDRLLHGHELADRVRRRLRDPEEAMFTLVRVHAAAVPSEQVGDALLRQVRAEIGDLVGPHEDGFLVVLQGTRPSQAGAFLARVQDALSTNGPPPRVDTEVISSATESDRICDLLGLTTE